MKVEKVITKSEELEIAGATLLSVEEAKNSLTKEERTYDYWWWLRSPGNHSFYAASVSYDGGVCYDSDFVDDSDGCVRPALQIKNFKSSNFKIGDIFKIKDYEFKIISENLAWLYKQDIGKHHFRMYWIVDDTNDYEKSDIKKYVDDWFEKLKEMSK